MHSFTPEIDFYKLITSFYHFLVNIIIPVSMLYSTLTVIGHFISLTVLKPQTSQS